MASTGSPPETASPSSEAALYDFIDVSIRYHCESGTTFGLLTVEVDGNSKDYYRSPSIYTDVTCSKDLLDWQGSVKACGPLQFTSAWKEPDAGAGSVAREENAPPYTPSVPMTGGDSAEEAHFASTLPHNAITVTISSTTRNDGDTGLQVPILIITADGQRADYQTRALSMKVHPTRIYQPDVPSSDDATGDEPAAALPTYSELPPGRTAPFSPLTTAITPAPRTWPTPFMERMTAKVPPPERWQKPIRSLVMVSVMVQATTKPASPSSTTQPDHPEQSTPLNDRHQAAGEYTDCSSEEEEEVVSDDDLPPGAGPLPAREPRQYRLPPGRVPRPGISMRASKPVVRPNLLRRVRAKFRSRPS